MRGLGFGLDTGNREEPGRIREVFLKGSWEVLSPTSLPLPTARNSSAWPPSRMRKTKFIPWGWENKDWGWQAQRTSSIKANTPDLNYRVPNNGEIGCFHEAILSGGHLLLLLNPVLLGQIIFPHSLVLIEVLSTCYGLRIFFPNEWIPTHTLQNTYVKLTTGYSHSWWVP